MALYTELLSEYLEGGGTLPSIFGEIAGFEELFISEYCDRELGFETETLFKIKLDATAELLFPAYKSKLQIYDDMIAKLQNPEKIREVIHDIGEQDSATWVLPFNDNTADPSGKTHADESRNVDTETERGYSSNEILQIMQTITTKSMTLKRQLLNEFRHLFMMIF